MAAKLLALGVAACGVTAVGGSEDATSTASQESGAVSDVPSDVAALECPPAEEVDPRFELSIGASLAPEIEVPYEYACVITAADAAAGHVEMICDAEVVSLSLPPNAYSGTYLAAGNSADLVVVRADDGSYWFGIADDEGLVVGGAGGSDWAQLLPSHTAVTGLLSPLEVQVYEGTDCPKYLVSDDQPDCPIWGRRIALEARVDKGAPWTLVYDETVRAVGGYQVRVKAHDRFTDPSCVASDYPSTLLLFLVGRSD